MRRTMAMVLLVASVTSGCMEKRMVNAPAACSPATANAAQSDIQMKLGLLKEKLRSDDIGKIEILAIPPGVESYSAVTPEVLSESYYYKLDINNIHRYIDSVTSSINSTCASITSHSIDIRWSITYFDKQGKSIISIYYNDTGNIGSIDGITVTVSGSLFKWIKEHFSYAFK